MPYRPTDEEVEELFRELLGDAVERWTRPVLPLAANLFLFAVCALSGRRKLAEAELADITNTVRRWNSPQSTFDELGLHREPAPLFPLGGTDFFGSIARRSPRLEGLRAIESAHVSGAEPFCLNALRAVAYACPNKEWERAARLAPGLVGHLLESGLVAEVAGRTAYTLDLDRKVDLVLALARRLLDAPVAATCMLNLFLAAVLVRAGIEAQIEPKVESLSQGKAHRRNASLAGLAFDFSIPNDPAVSSIAFHIGMGHIRARDERLFRYLGKLALLCPDDVWESVLVRAPDLVDALTAPRYRFAR